MQINIWKARVAEVAADFRQSWRQLLIVHLLYSAVVAIVLAPSLSLLLRLVVAVSGNGILSDLDIVFFFLRPIGLIAAVLIGAVVLTIAALELAALMIVGYGASRRRTIGYWDALVFTLRRTPGILRVAAEVVGRSVFVTAPFLAAGGATYWLLLTRHDINFYLNERPPVFWVAVGLIAAALVGLALALLRSWSGWFFALPLLLFDDIAAASALSASRRLATGRRLEVVQWIVAWFLAASLLGWLATAVWGGMARLVVPAFAESIGWLVFALGAFLVLASVTNFLVAFVNTSILGLLVVRLFQATGHGQEFNPLSADPLHVERALARWRLTVRQLVWGLVTAAVAALVVGALVLDSLRLEDDTEIIAHRAGASAAPENTMAAVRQAIAEKADWVEIDVQETADGEVVVIHDSDFKKVAGNPLKIWDATYAALQEIDIGSWFGPQFKHERVPKLAEVLDACRDKIGVNIELKYYGHDQQLEQRVVDIVESTNMTEQVVFMSLSYPGVQKLRALRPDWKVGLLTSVAVGNLAKLDVDFIAINAHRASPAFVRSAQKHGKQVLVWTVNDAIAMSNMMTRGVDGIITDKPALAASVLRERATLNPMQRALVELAEWFGVRPKYADQ